MTGLSGEKKEKTDVLKELIMQLREGADPEMIKETFEKLISLTDMPDKIVQIEEELIKEGIPPEEAQKLYDLHLATFREAFEKAKPIAPEGHPIHILMAEHKQLVNVAGDLRNLAKEIQRVISFDSISEQMEQVDTLVNYFKESESHYLREENVVFPYLERAGIVSPTRVMWMEHDQIRKTEKSLFKLLETYKSMEFQDFTKKFNVLVLSLAEMLSSHFYKENNILFPTSLKIIGVNEWSKIREQFDEIGYCFFTPKPPEIPVKAVPAPHYKVEAKIEGLMPFETGTLSLEQIEAIFDSLPVDITFIDNEDIVRYFNQSSERIFLRTKAVIGRTVQQCHPVTSLHVVNQILEEFKTGKRDVAEFWITFQGRLIHIRYFPVRNKNGEYLGCLEVTQDITDIQKIEGEKRLL